MNRIVDGYAFAKVGYYDNYLKAHLRKIASDVNKLEDGLPAHKPTLSDEQLDIVRANPIFALKRVSQTRFEPCETLTPKILEKRRKSQVEVAGVNISRRVKRSSRPISGVFLHVHQAFENDTNLREHLERYLAKLAAVENQVAALKLQVVPPCKDSGTGNNPQRGEKTGDKDGDGTDDEDGVKPLLCSILWPPATLG